MEEEFSVLGLPADGNFRLILGGGFSEPSSGKYQEIFSPSSGALVGRVAQATKEDVDRAFSEASVAQRAWAQATGFERSEILKRAAAILLENKKLLSNMLVAEIAKPRKQAEDEVVRTADLIEYTAEEAKRLQGEALFSDSLPGFKKNKVSIVERVPLGTVVAISPFNYPINLAASKIAAALAAGNCVVFKPATQGAISGMLLCEIFIRAGVPKGVLSAVPGKGSEIGDYLVSHEGASMIAFTGGTRTGKRIAEISRGRPLLMELGGKDAALVLPDADIEETAKNIVSGAFSYSGQRCTAVKRVLLVESANSDKLVSRIIELASALSVGSPEDNCDITPLIDSSSADYVFGLIEEAKEKGAKLLLGGRRDKNTISPTIFDQVPLSSKLAWEEPFGPVLPIIRVGSVSEAIEIANKSEYGLQASVFTRDLDQAFLIANRLDVGTVQVNGKPARGPDHFPFIGAKSSGVGTQGIRYSIEGMTRVKTIVLNLKG